MAQTVPTLTDLDPADATAERTVIVVGAGMAGLTAAIQLKRGGHRVVILEARMRAGGRVHTIRDPFADGMHAEAGAMYVPDNHRFTMKYVEELGLELVDVPPQDLHNFYYVGGERVTIGDDHAPVTWPVDIRPDEQELGLDGIYEAYFGRLEREAGDGTDPSFPIDDGLRQYDAVSVPELLQDLGASPAAADLLRVSAFGVWGDSGRDVSALSELQRSALLPGKEHGENWRTFREGTNALPRRLAAALSEEIRYGHEVIGIEQHDDQVVVTSRSGERVETRVADKVVVTVPFPVLQDVQFVPPLSPAKQKAIVTSKMTPLAHAFIQVRRRVWRDEGYGLSGIGFTDTPLGMIRDSTHNQSGERGLLNAYMTGQDANTMMALPEAERNAAVLAQFETIFPGVTAEAEEIVWHDWTADPFARGGYAFFGVGEFTELWPQMGTPEGDIHFAGDHTSYFRAWMDGAIQSAHRAAREIHES